MKKGHFVATLALVLTTITLLMAPGPASSVGHFRLPTVAPSNHFTFASGPSVVTPSVPTPKAGFARTVLVETFTGVWCIHCPAESSALHNIDGATNRSVIDIAELHVCAFPPGSGPCLENYVPPDGTSDARGAFYSVCGFPDVFFDGLHDSCGASNSIPETQNDYQHKIANASAYPGNVSISQSALVVGGNVTLHANVTSAVTGTYNAVSYLLEKIDKLNQSNGYGPHDVDNVVRKTLVNHPVSLVAGGTTEIDAMGAIATGWNDLNFSVVTFIQQNSTKIVENANWVSVPTMTTAFTINRTSVSSSGIAGLTVKVANSTTGNPVSGAAVTLLSDTGGVFSPASGVTASDGSFSATFQAPTVLASTNLKISVQVAAPDYTLGTGTVNLLVNPIVVPDVPTSLNLGAGKQQVTLNWTAPASGANGLTYHIYRAVCRTTGFSEISTSLTSSYNDTGLAAGQCYTYKVNAQNFGGFSSNTSALSASGVTIQTQGLPTGVGWWVDIATKNFTSHTNASLALYLPSGTFSYSFGPTSYAYEGTGAGSAIVVTVVPLTVPVAFVPRYATLAGTVTPASASVTVDGVVVAVVGGAFSEALVAGTYTVNVSANGYVANSSAVTLTPGNLTTWNVPLNKVPSTAGSSGSVGGLSTTDALLVAVGVIAAIAIVGGAAVVASRKQRSRMPRSPRQDSQESDGPNDEES
ncbi:MAG: hypothetical protein L3K23_02280 [Thermoplasmata archaeon]|nr:hypothetical protein [Thermoplasmata archaeon]